jgi:hypothetical protein
MHRRNLRDYIIGASKRLIWLEVRVRNMGNADSYQNRTSYQSRRSKAIKAAVQGVHQLAAIDGPFLFVRHDK